jgi:parvulin-like peptidyl-prolyl isomerase
VLWEVNKIIESQADNIPPEQIGPIRQQLVQRSVVEMIDRKIIYAEFRRNIPAENMPKIEEQLQQLFEDEEAPKLMKKLGVNNRQDMEKELVRLGSSLADVQRTFNERAIVSNWVRSKVKINEEVNPGEMLNYYRAHLADYDYPTQARWEELTVRKGRFANPGDAYAELAKMGNEAWMRGAAVPGGVHGPAFAEVAKTRSDGLNAKEGGQYNWTPKGALKVAVIDDALFKLEVGQMSSILESDTAFHIVRVLERKEAGRRSFAEVQGDIREKLKEERFQKAVSAYLGKLHQTARVWTEQSGNVSAETFLAQAQAGTQKR